MLGSTLSKKLFSMNHQVFALSSKEFDITNNQSILESLDKNKPDLVINCAAYTNVEMAE